METPFSGTALLLLVAAGLWLVYLVPIWMRRSEYLATERNATRLGQTLRVLAETSEATEELRAELNARDVAKAKREAERKLQQVSYTPQELVAKRRRILRSTTTLFTAIGLAGLVSSISVQAALWVTFGLAVKTSIGLLTLWILARHQRMQRAAVAAPVAVHRPTSRHSRASAREWTPPTLPEPLSAKQPGVQPSPLPSREELLKKARIAAAEARPAEAVAEAEKLAPVSQFDQMGRVPGATPSARPDLDEVLRRRRAV